MATFPERAVASFNGLVSQAIDAALGPLSGLPAFASLFVVALVSALPIILVIARTSNQDGLRQSKRDMHAALLEIRLFNDDLRAVLLAGRDAVRHNARYVLLSLVPLAWLVAPFAVVVVHLQAYYGYDGLTPGSAFLVTATLRDELVPESDVSLDAADGVRVDAGPARLLNTNQVVWRLVPTHEGEHVITVRAGSEQATKSIVTSTRIARRSPQRVSPAVLDQLLHPSEPPLRADGIIEGIAVMYPEREIDIAGWHVHWAIVYVVLSIGCVFALAQRFRIVL